MTTGSKSGNMTELPRLGGGSGQGDGHKGESKVSAECGGSDRACLSIQGRGEAGKRVPTESLSLGRLSRWGANVARLKNPWRSGRTGAQPS